MSDLATIQKIRNVKPHLNADSLELAEVLGWQVVVKKNEFKIGDFCVYICVDTILPDKPEFEFLRNKNFRIKPIKLRGEPSNGICFPISILPSAVSIEEGMDVTDIIGVIKYEKPIPAQLSGQVKGHLPSFIKMTDEPLLRHYPLALNELLGKSHYITLKLDGSSGTFFYKDDEFGVCSRRLQLKEDDKNTFWKLARKYDIENNLKSYFDCPIAIQGECVGPGIQKNPIGLKEITLYLFNIFDISSRTYYPLDTLEDFCKKSNIPMVPIIEKEDLFRFIKEDSNSIDNLMKRLVQFTNQLKYENNSYAEGIVIRPQISFHSFVLKRHWSAKIINENYEE